MASVSGTSRNNYTSSLYNSANIVSGLASGMDTEGMIESLVQSYNTKIQNLTNKATKIQWKQDSYRSIISKMYAFSNKYTSYTSANNLASPSFFNNARLVEPQGKYAEKVSASGRTDSDVVLNQVDQLAAAARYVTSGNLNAGDGVSIQASGAVDLGSDIKLGTLQGSLSLSYGSKTISISFDENADQFANKQQLVNAIREKLGNEQITFSGGTTAKASDRIDVALDSSGNITFSEKGNAGNSVYITGASGTVAEQLNLKGVSDSDKVTQIRPAGNSFTKNVNTAEYLSGKSFNINLDGTTKTVYAPKIEKNENGSYTFTLPTTVKDSSGQTKTTYEGGKSYTVSAQDVAKEYTKALSDSVNKAFGDKVRVSNSANGNGKLALKFETNDGSNLLINTSAGDVLKIGQSASSYLNTSKTLKELGIDLDSMPEDSKVYEGEGDDRKLVGYKFTLNGEEIGVYNKDTKLSQIMSDINSNTEAGVKVNYSRTTRSFVFETRETGSQSKIEFGDDLGKRLFQQQTDGGTTMGDVLGRDYDYPMSYKFDIGGKSVEVFQPFDKDAKDVTVDELVSYVNGAIAGNGMTASFDKETGSIAVKDADGNKVDVSFGDDATKAVFEKLNGYTAGYTAGQDAKFTVTVNGVRKEMTRGTNTADIDGLNITFKDKFEDDGMGVSFNVSTDSDKIVDAVKSMVSDYNEMMSEIKSAYSTLPYQNSSGAFQTYEPLSDEDRATMSESAIQAYEAKAKQGILFGDSNLKSLYERMYSVFSPSGADNAMLQKMGLTFSYSSDGTSALTLDENKLRSALESDPDGVMDIFTRTSATGGASGIMEGLKTQLDRYGATTGAVKGILVQQAGTPLSSLSLLDNEWQSQIDSLGTQIEKWQDKLSNRVDYYTSMFSRLEVLINQMNSQSSTLAGLMGS